MPFTSGTSETPSTLLNAMNAHLVANGWTKLRGESDMNVAGPKAARYWRVLVFELQVTGNQSVGVQLLHFKTVIAGANVATVAANWVLSSLAVGTTALLVSGGLVRSAVIFDRAWSATYDFGVATTIREMTMRADTTVGNTPRDFLVQWSNDNKTWTTINRRNALVWTASETKSFSWADGVTDATHASATGPRRTGRGEDFGTLTTIPFTDTFCDLSDDVWIWQGPGYDAARRVYIHARGHTRNTLGTYVIEWGVSIGYNASALNWSDHPGFSTVQRSHLFQNTTVNYWFYSNSKRIILITRSGAQDYMSSYVGFLSAFGTPDQYPFPLAIFTTTSTKEAFVFGDTDNRLSSCVDPGLAAAVVRLWDGTEIYPSNRDPNVATNLFSRFPATSWVWPIHPGSVGRPLNPAGWAGDWNDYVGAHFFDNFVATRQSHLPLFPCIVQHDPFGNVGALDGLFALPSGGILSPTSILTIAGQNYRIFANRTRRNGVNFFAVRED